jgi:hypothetical protein
MELLPFIAKNQAEILRLLNESFTREPQRCKLMLVLVVGCRMSPEAAQISPMVCSTCRAQRCTLTCTIYLQFIDRHMYDMDQEKSVTKIKQTKDNDPTAMAMAIGAFKDSLNRNRNRSRQQK